ncbi:S41 family peptidase, partial [Pseudomonas sp. 2822-17]|uniref:S41 family peptidase n=1 Tax=Pseudomonas sp. 2822-17 TaxID=1712678 RepID=UPI001C44A1CA
TLVIEKWFEELFDSPVSLNSQVIRLFSNTGNTFVQDTVDLYESHGYVLETFDDEINDFYLFDQFDYPMEEPQWEYEYYPFEAIEDNDIHIFILIDRGTASAGEHITSFLKNVNNTTVIGVNSA